MECASFACCPLNRVSLRCLRRDRVPVNRERFKEFFL